jgi:nucleoside-diphosphate-sugar epimerase
MVDLYELLLRLPDEAIAGQTFNAGYQNHSIMEIARIVRQVVTAEFPGRRPIDIVTTPTNDIRSYHINSDKIAARLGFRPKRGIADAAGELCRAFRDGKLPDGLTDQRYFNVATLKAKRAA